MPASDHPMRRKLEETLEEMVAEASSMSDEITGIEEALHDKKYKLYLANERIRKAKAELHHICVIDPKKRTQ